MYIQEVIMDYKLTSVKILKKLYRDFKTKTVETEFTLQKLVNRSMDLYVLDSDFKNKIHSYNNLIPSGSRL
jgi:hypothetical protein